MNDVEISVDPCQVLDQIGVDDAVSHYGVNDVIDYISVKEYLKNADLDEVLDVIHSMDDEKIREYATEVYSD